MAQCKPRVVATHLSIERRIAIDKVEGEAELLSEKLGGHFQVTNVEVRRHQLRIG